MRKAMTSLLLIACVTADSGASAQSAAKAAGNPATRACALLTRDMVLRFGANVNTKMLDLIPPEEDQIGAAASGCQYGGIYLQINPFARAEQLRKSPPKDWIAVAGVGDAAFFHNNRNTYAELMVWSGAHHFTIQMSVPTGSSAESIKPNTIELAKALIPKLP